MNEQQLNDELTKLLDEAKGEVTIKVNGMESHAKGDMNRSGALMVAYVAIKCLEVKGFSDCFEESIKIIEALESVINSKITPN